MTTTTAAPNQARNPKVQAWLDARKPETLLIGGEWVAAESGKTFDTVNPTTEQVLASVSQAGPEDVEAAVTAARAAFESGPWSQMAPNERARLLRNLAGLMEENVAELAELETLDNGMTIGTAQAFMQVAIESIYYYAGAVQQVFGSTAPSAPGNFNYILRQPLGVVGAIIPWNAPVTAASWKIGPALAAGNTMILKPAESTPLTAIRLGELITEAGFPPGVFNLLTGFGPEVGQPMADHYGIDKLTFTGSVGTGRGILHAAANTNLKRVTLELGGKSPNIIFPDADMDAAVANSLAGFATISGQVCVAGTRLFVQRDVKDEVVEALTGAAESLTVGDPLDPATTMGPLANKAQFDRVQSYFEVGKGEGAVAKAGGETVDRPGYFVKPTVFDGVENSMRIAQEEIFGPVVSVIPFSDEYDAVLQGNDTTYGLAAAVWTRDISRAHTVARQIQAGTVWINTYLQLDPTMPFGGFKESGLGREFGPDWYQHFTEEKSVFVKL
ncbi:MAG: aldehyde dehydrogenase family protein [Gordonia sp. (in: high G+C Gram-positive bacteria)]|uniref:aldehyde dehydrogenase family protein n=1 Tax=Gordonia sp. (in: high G+C Gram-positive bacteria) TaxID=84139 RepID=UPI0039E65B69